ncbi:MAG: hypothetical protein ACK5YM_03430 [Pseudomonadota bacterium]
MPAPLRPSRRRLLLGAVAACGGLLSAARATAQPGPATLRQPPPPHGSDAPGQGALRPAPRHPPPRWAGDPPGWEIALVDGVEVLFPDEAPLLRPAVVPAGGPLARFMSRPGAWYGALFVPLAPGWPVQLWLRQRARSHELRLTVLDGAPWGAPSVAVPLPTRSLISGGRPTLTSLPFVLPPGSRADGVFLLVEQWSMAGDRPPALWLQARSRISEGQVQRPWWSSGPEPTAPAAPGTGLAPATPAGPLSAPRVGGDGVIQLPIVQRLALPRPVDDRGPP